MKLEKLVLFFFVMIFFSLQAKAEINSKKALMEVFEGCVEEESEGVSVGAQFEYCACVTKQISIGMDLEEVMLLGLDMMAAKNEKEEERILISNQKVKKYVSKCAVRLYE